MSQRVVVLTDEEIVGLLGLTSAARKEELRALLKYPEGITDDMVERGGKALYDKWFQITTFFRGWDETRDEFCAEARIVLQAAFCVSNEGTEA